MGRIVAIGGHESPIIFGYIVKMTGKEKPNFLFVATPSSDKTEYYAQISMMVSAYGCDTRPLYLIRRKYAKEQLDKLFAWADIIYVCGGDTFSAVQTWKKQGIDLRLREVFEKDSAVLCGSSAGGICWFARGFSDSSRTPEYGTHGWVDGIGIFGDKVFCPHLSSRKDSFRKALRDSGAEGFGLDNNTAYVYENGSESFVRSDPDGQLLSFTQNENGLCETVPESVLLTDS